MRLLMRTRTIRAVGRQDAKIYPQVSIMFRLEIGGGHVLHYMEARCPAEAHLHHILYCIVLHHGSLT